MNGTTILEIFLAVQAFILGALAVFAWQHWRTHLRPRPNQPQTIQPQPSISPVGAELPTAVKERLLQATQAQFETVMSNSAGQLQKDLGVTVGHVNNLVLRLATEIISGELERYRAELAQLGQQAAADLGGIRSEIAKHKAEIEAKIAQEMAAEKQKLVKQIDTKLADAVGSFLVETLQHNVDLGSQSTYLIAQLEEHKADFLKEVADEAQPTR